MVYFDIVKTKKPVNHLIYRLLVNFDFPLRRDTRIRTWDPLLPKQVR